MNQVLALGFLDELMFVFVCVFAVPLGLIMGMCMLAAKQIKDKPEVKSALKDAAKKEAMKGAIVGLKWIAQSLRK